MSKSSTELLGNYITEYSVKNKNGADIPVYSVSNDKGFCRDYFSKDVSSKDKTSYKIVPRGCFAYNPSRINVGSIAWQDKEDAVIVSPLYVVFSTEGLNNDFLMYYLKSNALMSYIKIYSAGAVRNNLRFKTLSSFPVKVPSLEQQARIVAELDCLTGIIEKKKQQLEDLDKLAQSIFYDMFGDIAHNSKQFHVEKICDLGELARGVSKHRPRNAPELLGGEMPLIQTGDVANADLFIREYHSTYSALGVSQSRVWEKGTICITIAANIGNCAILSFRACFPDSVVGFIHNDKLSLFYALFVFNNLQALLEEKARGIAQKNINLQILNELLIPVPPRNLQDLFAEKIEAIEKQKELVKRSIVETETLFNSRMDFWFN